ncbi:MAG: cryptochrome/photolyase family protein [Gammaproteobacteria bacterium]|nr:cryptochrome/photolyase family protein [Gammaproteobacteria bacterium]
MKHIGLIFPDDLASNNKVLSIIKKDDPLLLFEPCDSFYQINHHKHKLVLQISALRHWKLNLEKDFKNIIHIKISKDRKTDLMYELDLLFKKIQFDVLNVTQPSDHGVLTQLMFFCSKNNVELKIYPDTKFIDSIEGFSEWVKDKKSIVQEFYYRWLRKKYNLLMENDKPLGGKWNYDKENQKSISKLKDTPKTRTKLTSDQITITAMVDVENCFPNSIGDLENFNWAVTHTQARNQLKTFLKNYFRSFGDFQDAIDQNNTTLFHSLLSPYINCGLLDPMECIVDAVGFFNKKENNIPLNALEGFVRQILGWREFIRGVYWDNMPQYKKMNFWSHKNTLHENWYSGETGIPPLDDAIKESSHTGYTHHINRLMIISNLMNLSNIRPDEVYKWFMEMYVDSADWVMVPNVYGMGTYADGGIFSTKPYICGSSYMLRMSNYKKGEWCDAVDGLYWRFIENNRDFFATNPRLSLMTRSLDKIDPSRKIKIFSAAEKFIEKNTN